MKITRRQLLAATGALTAAAAVGAGSTAIRWWDRPAGAGLLALSEREREVVDAIAEAWMPPGGEPSVSGREAGCGAFVDEVVSRMPDLQRKLFKTLLHALDERTLVTHLHPFRSLPLDERTSTLASWAHSSLFLERQAVSAVLAIIAFGYVLHPDVSAVFSPLFGCGFGA